MSLGRDFWLFAIGRFVSELGWAVQDVALPLYVLAFFFFKLCPLGWGTVFENLALGQESRRKA